MLLTCPVLIGLRVNHGNPCLEALDSRALFLRRRRKERVFLLQSVAETWPDLAFFLLGVPLLRYLLILIIILISRSSYFLSVEKSYLGQKYKHSDRRGEGGPPG